MAEWGIRRASVNQRSFLAHGQIMQNRYLYLVLHCILLLVGSYMVVTVPSTVSFWPMPTKLNHDVDFLEFLAVWLVWMASDGIGKVGTITYVTPRIRSFDFDLAFVPGFLTVLRRLWCHICHLGHKKMKGPQIRIYNRSLFSMSWQIATMFELSWYELLVSYSKLESIFLLCVLQKFCRSRVKCSKGCSVRGMPMLPAIQRGSLGTLGIDAQWPLKPT